MDPNPKPQPTQSNPKKLRNLSIKIFLGHIDKNIDNLSQSLSTTLTTIKQQIESQPQSHSQSNPNSQSVPGNQHENGSVDGDVEYGQIVEEMECFVEELRCCPGFWLEFIQEGEIDVEDRKIVLNRPYTITQIYEKIMDNVNNKVSKKRSIPFNFQSCYCDETVCNLLAMILNFISQQIVLSYERSKAFIIQQTQKIQQLIKKSQIMNSYLLFSLLKQLSKGIHAHTKNIFIECFDQLPMDIVEKFCRYIQKNYQLVHLHYVEGGEHRILGQEEMEEIVRKRNLELINLICRLAVKKNDGEEGKGNGDGTGEKKGDFEENLIKEMTEENNIKDKKKRKFWKLVDIKDSISGVFKIFKSNVEGEITADTSHVIQNDLMSGVSQSASLGGSLGKCLVDIDQYQSVNDFFTDLSKTAMVAGSITILLEQIPIFNYFIIAGGLSYTVYRTYKDQITSSQKKMKNVGKASIVAVGSVGSTATGMVIGEMLIPIPFFGAFVGGVIGGYFGEKGSRQITNIMNNQSFMKIIAYLQSTIIDHSHWQYSDKTLQKLGISKKYFQQTFPQSSPSKNLYTTLICFCIACYYQSRKQLQYTQHQLQQSQQQPQPHPQTHPEPQHQQIDKKSSIKNIFSLHSQKNMFEAEFNVVAIVEYLSKNQVRLVDELGKIQGIVRQYVV